MIIRIKNDKEKMEKEYASRDNFVEELAYALNDHDVMEVQYLNLTDQSIFWYPNDVDSWGERWPAEGDEVIPLEIIPTWKAFRQMEEFAESIKDRKAAHALRLALEKRHPFSAFRYAAERTGVIQQWYQWRDSWQKEQAEEWMRDHGVDFKDGKVVADKKYTQTWHYEDDET